VLVCCHSVRAELQQVRSTVAYSVNSETALAVLELWRQCKILMRHLQDDKCTATMTATITITRVLWHQAGLRSDQQGRALRPAGQLQARTASPNTLRHQRRSCSQELR
jgi:hypothetical protein